MAGSKLILTIICSVVALSLQLPLASAHWYGSAVASVGTFNAQLFRAAPGFQERKEQLITTLQRRWQNQVPDVLCLQEVSRASDILEIAEAVKSQYPYQASFTDLNGGPPSPQPACSLEDVTEFRDCIQQSTCGNLTGGAFLNCSRVECRENLFQTSIPCRFCVGVEGEGNVVAGFTQCATVIPASEYADPFGLLLLSRYRLTDIETVDYHPVNQSVLPRGYVSAKVPSLGQSVLCTHMEALLTQADYVGPSEFTSYAQQQADEVKTVLEFVERENQVILLGTFNHGPATPGLTWVLPFSYGLLTARGLFSANALWCGQCTLCAEENVLAAPSNLTANVDHIYLPTSRISAVLRVDRLFDDIQTPSGLPLSDHFGVSARLLTRRGSWVRCPGSNVLGRHVDFQELDDIEDQVDQFCLTE